MMPDLAQAIRTALSVEVEERPRDGVTIARPTPTGVRRNRVVAFVGKHLRLRGTLPSQQAGGLSLQWSVTRRPPDGAEEVTEGRYFCDVPGVHTLTGVAAEVLGIDVEIVVLDPAAQTAAEFHGNASWPGNTSSRVLQAVISDPRAGTEQLIQAIELDKRPKLCADPNGTEKRLPTLAHLGFSLRTVLGLGPDDAVGLQEFGAPR